MARYKPVLLSKPPRKTPEDDYERLAERIWKRGRGKIKNKADFVSVYTSYLKDVDAKDNKALREAVFGKLQSDHPKVSSSLVSKKERVEVFVEAGKRPSPGEFKFQGFIRGRQVAVRRTKYRRVYASGRVVEPVVYRDRKGRFAKVVR